jgi:uncharacterized integral membrane protein
VPVLRPTNEERGPVRLSARAWTLLAVVAAVLALAFGGGLGRWVAFALILAIAPTLIEPLSRLPWVADNRERVARWLPLALLVTLTAMLLGDLALGRAPASRDHAVHYFQTKVLVDELIPHGELIGLSERLNSGYPFGDSYPVLGYVLTGAANLLSFGLISLRTSYAWGLLAIWLLALWAVWWLAETIARELRGEAIERPPGDAPAEAPPLAGLIDPRWAGALAAIAWLIDPGSAREGGWNYLMFHGVWPQLLSSALWVASLPATWAALRRPSPRSLAFAGLLLGGSVLAHPFGMLTAATSAIAWPIVLWASGAQRLLPGGQIRWWLIIHVLAGLVCVGWVVTFLASAGSMARSPVPWRPLGDLATDLLVGELFRDYRAWVGPLTVIGMFVAIRRGRAMAWLCVGLVCATLVLGSEASVTVLRLDLLASSFKNLQFPRYSIALKPLLYALAGIGGAVLLAKLRELPRRDHPATEKNVVRPAAARLIACICLAPLVAGIVNDRSRLFPRPVGGTEVLEGSPHAAVDEALLERLRAEAELLAAEPEPRELTVAFLRGGMGGGTYALFAITDANGKLVMDGHIPAVNYKYQVKRRSPSALRMLGVTHVIHDHPLDRSSDDRQLAEALEIVDTFGVWTLGRLAPDDASPKFATGGKIEPADVRVTRASRTELQVKVLAGAGRVDLPIGPYRKWSAVREDGSAVPLSVASLARGIPGVQVPIAGPGIVSLEYKTPTRERVAMWVSLIGILLLLAALASNRELQLAVRLQSERAGQLSWALGIVTLAVVVVGGYLREEKQLEVTWKRLFEEHRKSSQLAKGRELRFRADLVDSGAFTVTRSTTDGCDGTLGKDAMAGCTQADARPRRSMVFRAPYLYRCLHVMVPANGTLDIELEDLRDTDDITGFFVRDLQHFDGLSVQLPGQDTPIVPPQQQRRHPFHVTVEARGDASTIHLRNEAIRAQGLCFVLAAAHAQ